MSEIDHWEIAALRRDVDALATKLRDVVTALVEADGALFARIERLDTFVMDSAFGLDPSATQPASPDNWHGVDLDLLRDAPPGAMIEFTPPYSRYPKRGTCTLPPLGWYCTLESGHDGDTCPTVPERIRLSPWQWIKNKLGMPIF